ncbi:MAG TPA: radical SAM protein [Candidatus Bathyarchaeia archaeon]|nr:radical SAM protein [Candidatus Bathyarchaeia archaeon]
MAGVECIRTLVAVLTAQCNLRCSYCYQNAKNPRSMPWETLRASIDLILHSRSKNVYLYFTGGEPLLEFAMLRRAVEYVEANRPAEKQVNYGITTNGTLLSQDTASFLENHLFDVQLSFDGVADAQDRRAPGTFALLDSLLDRLRDAHADFFRHNVTVGITITPSTIVHLPVSVDYFLGKGAEKISVSPSLVWDPAWRTERIAELDAAFARVFDSSMRHLRTASKVPVLAFRNHGASMCHEEGRPMCGIVQGHGMAVDVDGHAYGCATIAGSYQRVASPFMRDTLESMRMGSIHDHAFAERYASFPEAARRAGMFDRKERKYSAYRRCAECDAFTACSVCPVCIGSMPGNTDPDRMNDFCCAVSLASLKYREHFPRERGPDDLRAAWAELAATKRRWEALAEASKAARLA